MRLRPRSIVVGVLLVAATLAISVWSIMVGDFPLSVGQVLRSLFGDGGDDAEFIVQTLRLPRAITAMLVGAALGMSAPSSSRSSATRSVRRTSSASSPVPRPVP